VLPWQGSESERPAGKIRTSDYGGSGRQQESELKTLWVMLGVMVLAGCTGMPESVTPVSGFDLNRYLGRWYEIARLDHSFERGLSDVTAEYRLGDDGRVLVVNRGFSQADNEWREAQGKAYFVNSEQEGYLKVSFFGPFYGAYVIFELDRVDYQYAFVAGPNTNYLWLLSRTPSVTDEVLRKFTDMAEERGFDTQALIFVQHNREVTPP
jgi:apolipoprotein D and lipocalin family protein